MFKFFSSIANLIATVVKYIVSMFSMLIMLITRVIQAFAYVVLSVSWLPAYLKVYVIAMIAVAVILFIVNRGDD